MQNKFALAALSVFALAACSEDRDITAPTAPVTSVNANVSVADGGTIFTLRNLTTGNYVSAFNQDADGNLSSAGEVATGGNGTGAGLGSQGALTASEEGRWLFAVNAGSNQVSVLSVGKDGIALADVTSSGGTRPISVTAFKNVVYVLNAGGSGNIAGFTKDKDGNLTAINGSIQPLSGASVGAAQVSFSSDGKWLVVTEKATNKIDVYPVNKNGVAGSPVIQASAGTTPFGFAFGKQNELVVSEAGTGSASSYGIGGGGNLGINTAVAPLYQNAPCWVTVTKNGRFAYVANAQSGSISGYSIAGSGAISLLNPSGVTAIVNAGATDLTVSGDSRYLYQLDGSRISAFRVQSNGQLQALGTIAKPASSTVGIAAL
ncbi:MAG: beta-propeller fold lactonase family protein [Gemmatimonadales bacterium]